MTRGAAARSRVSRLPRPPPCAVGDTPTTYTSPYGGVSSCTFVQWNPTSRWASGGEEEPARVEPRLGHRARRGRRASSRPARGGGRTPRRSAQQRLLVVPHLERAYVDPVGVLRRVRGRSARDRRITHRSRTRSKPWRAARAAAAGWLPCDQAVSGPRVRTRGRGEPAADVPARALGRDHEVDRDGRAARRSRPRPRPTGWTSPARAAGRAAPPRRAGWRRPRSLAASTTRRTTAAGPCPRTSRSRLRGTDGSRGSERSWRPP